MADAALMIQATGPAPGGAVPLLEDVSSAFFMRTALGVCDDSVRALRTRLTTVMESYINPSRLPLTRDAVMQRPLNFAVGCFGPAPLLQIGQPMPTTRIEQALARKDFAGARRQLDSLQRGRRLLRPGEFALDYTVTEAWMRAVLGDTAAAIRQLDLTLTALPTLLSRVVYEPGMAAAGRTQHGDARRARREAGRPRIGGAVGGPRAHPLGSRRSLARADARANEAARRTGALASRSAGACAVHINYQFQGGAVSRIPRRRVRHAAAGIIILVAACARKDSAPPPDSGTAAAPRPATASRSATSARGPVFPGALVKPIDSYTGDELYTFTSQLTYAGSHERDRDCKNSSGCEGPKPTKKTKVQVSAVATQDSLAESNVPEFGVVYARAINKGADEEARYGFRADKTVRYYMIVQRDMPAGGCGGGSRSSIPRRHDATRRSARASSRRAAMPGRPAPARISRRATCRSAATPSSRWNCVSWAAAVHRCGSAVRGAAVCSTAERLAGGPRSLDAVSVAQNAR